MPFIVHVYYDLATFHSCLKYNYLYGILHCIFRICLFSTFLGYIISACPKAAIWKMVILGAGRPFWPINDSCDLRRDIDISKAISKTILTLY